LYLACVEGIISKWDRRPNVATLSDIPSHTITDIVPGSVISASLGLNDALQIVGFYVDANAQEHGFIKTGGAYTPLDAPNAAVTAPFDINNLGTIVGDMYDATGHLHGFIKTGNSFQTIDVPWLGIAKPRQSGLTIVVPLSVSISIAPGMITDSSIMAGPSSQLTCQGQPIPLLQKSIT